MVTLLRTLADHGDDISCCAFSALHLATCSLDKTVRVYSLSTLAELPYSPLAGHRYAVHCCCFSPSGRVLASCSTDGSTLAWDAGAGRLLAVLEQPRGSPVRVCRFSPGASLLSGAADGGLVLWDTRSWRPRGPLLATGSMDKTVNIWQLDLKQPYAGNTVENESKLDVEDWSEDDVSAWLCAEDLADFVGLFKKNNIDGKELLNLTKESLTDELKIESLGLRSKVLQKIEELKMKMISLPVTIPDEFLCPITRELMKDPVIAADGYSYEREAMENWISTKRRASPMTNLPLPFLMLTPNRTLKMAINRWLETQQKCS